MTWEKQGLDKKYTLLTLQDLPKIDLGYIVEDSGTFAGDAEIKARAYAKAYNIPTISQDRGFIFDVLNWPGTDSKKVMFGSEEKVYRRGSNDWNNEKEDNTVRVQEALDKIANLDRSMRVIQGLAIALPDGSMVSESFETLGVASKKIVNIIGGTYDWFLNYE